MPRTRTHFGSTEGDCQYERNQEHKKYTKLIVRPTIIKFFINFENQLIYKNNYYEKFTTYYKFISF
jgi:hypothetical protein